MTRERILIVDDESDIALILKLQLEDAGYDTIRAKDGGEALELLHREEFSLVLLDIKLPKLDGLQVLEHLGPALQEMAIVMMTAHGSEDVAVESMKKGALDYIAKPFSAEDLLKKVGRALEFNKTRKENLFLQNQLEEERKKMAAILAGMADMMVATDSEGRVISINQATANALAIDLDSPFGVPIEDFLPSDLPPARLPCKVVLRTLSPCLDVSHSIHARGRIIPVLSSATPLFSVSGKLVGSVEILRDISHLKALEREREEFVSMLTHDLKTPLTAVMGSVDLVRESRLGAINDEQKEYLDSATESCGEIVEMIDTLLDVYRFESGKMSLAFTEEDLGAILRKSLASFRALAERSDIILTVKISDDLPPLRLDRNKVGRLFGNLLSNAFKFTEEGGKVNLSAGVVKNLTGIRESIPPGTYQTELIPERGSFVKVEVSDTGIGIPKDALGSIFDKFVQARNRREGKIRGTGLGLAFCRKVIDAHGGLLWAESDLGKGSVFTVLFPMVPEEKSGV